MANGKGNKKQEIKEIRSNIIEQKRQLIIKIPLEIIKNFRIDPNRFDFGWTILDDDGKITINGRFIHNIPNEKKNK